MINSILKMQRFEAEAVKIRTALLAEIDHILDCHNLEMMSLHLAPDGYVEVRDVTETSGEGVYVLRFTSPAWDEMKAVAEEEVELHLHFRTNPI